VFTLNPCKAGVDKSLYKSSAYGDGTLRGSFFTSLKQKEKKAFLLNLKFGNFSRVPSSKPNSVALKEERGRHLKVYPAISSGIRTRKTTRNNIHDFFPYTSCL
jgi:hypothetical protein